MVTQSSSYGHIPAVHPGEHYPLMAGSVAAWMPADLNKIWMWDTYLRTRPQRSPVRPEAISAAAWIQLGEVDYVHSNFTMLLFGVVFIVIFLVCFYFSSYRSVLPSGSERMVKWWWLSIYNAVWCHGGCHVFFILPWLLLMCVWV